VERELSERLGLRVRLLPAGKGGSLCVHYTSMEQLDGVIALLSRD
jgi:hypothetical protein